MTDIQIIRKNTGQLQPRLVDKTTQDSIRIYQKVLVLLLTNNSALFRQQCGTSLLKALAGINYYNDQILNNLVQAAKLELLSSLQEQDSQLLQALQLSVSGSSISVNIILKDGTTQFGVIDASQYT